MAAVVTLILVVWSLLSGPITAADFRAAADLYPKHALLQLSSNRTSQLQQALQHEYGSGAAAVLLVLTGDAVLVDRPLRLQQGQSLVVATPAALQQAAAAAASGKGRTAAAAGPALQASQLLWVQCRTSKTGAFLDASAGAAAVELLGLAIQDCPGTAIVVEAAEKLLLQDTVLLRNNHKLQEDSGGALAVKGVEQVVLRRVSCVGNFALLSGGCLMSLRSKQLLITHSRFRSNWRDEPDRPGGGGAVWAKLTGNLTITRSDFQGNTALGSVPGGALLVTNGGPVLVQHSSFANNSAENDGGSVYAEGVELVTIDGCNFTANGVLPPALDETDEDGNMVPSLTPAGAGVAMRGTMDRPLNLVISNSRFVGNKVIDGGASVYCKQTGAVVGQVQVTGGHFEDNDGGFEAGGVMIDENPLTNLTVRDSSFVANVAQLGAALSLYDTTAVVDNCSFSGNTAESDGGAIQAFRIIGAGNSLRITRCSFADNKATDGGIGGAVAVDGQQLVMQDVKITGSSAAAGGALSVQSAPSAHLQRVTFSSNEAEGNGGAVSIARVANVSLDQVLLDGNKASKGGGIWLESCSNVSLRRLNLTANAATTAGGMGITHCMVVALATSTLTDNIAGAWADDGSDERDSSSLQLNSRAFLQGTAGAVLLQRSAASITSCSFAGNSAQADGGALAAQQLLQLSVVNSVFDRNLAQQGEGGAVVIRGMLPGPLTASLDNCSFAGNAARGRSGGALLLDATVGRIDLSCGSCSFEDNQAAHDGGGIAALGSTRFQCTNCRAHNNSAAAGSGGWLACASCSAVAIQNISSSSNRAAVGGSESCSGCGEFSTTGGSYALNTAQAGGAVAVQASSRVHVAGCNITNNTAVGERLLWAAPGAINKLAQPLPDARSAPPLLPAAWQALYAAPSGSAPGAVTCSGGGEGGGVCISGAQTATLTSNTFERNTGSTGGALSASHACTDGAVPSAAVAEAVSAPQAAQAPAEAAVKAASSSADCSVRVFNLSTADNSAAVAGGGFYTSTPINLQLAATAAADIGGSSFDESEQLRQLANNNTVAAGGYGPGAASSPVRLSLQAPSVATVGSTAGPPQAASYAAGDSKAGARRMLLQASSSSNARRSTPASSFPGGRILLFELSALSTAFKENLNVRSSAGDVTDAALPSVCSALGATVLGDQQAAVDSGQPFRLPVYLLDFFSSQVSRGPGSSWRVSLRREVDGGEAGSHEGNVSVTAAPQLAGDATARLQGGFVLMNSLVLLSNPDSRVLMTLQVMPPDGSKPTSTSIQVLVRPCLPGQQAVITTSSDNATSITCQQCAAGSFSFTAYRTATGAGDGATSRPAVCQACPSTALCIGGMLIPAQGSYQPHPRSAAVHACPHRLACTRSSNAMQELQAIQCANRQFIKPQDVSEQSYSLLQCRTGYAGPFCSCCYRPGRSAWLLQQQQQRQALAAGPTTMMSDAATFDASTVYGRGSGRCKTCPHIAVAWIGFLLARMLDMLLVGLLASLWLALGWLSSSSAAIALAELKIERFAGLRVGSSLPGSRMLSKVLSSASFLSSPKKRRPQPSVVAAAPSPRQPVLRVQQAGVTTSRATSAASPAPSMTTASPAGSVVGAAAGAQPVAASQVQGARAAPAATTAAPVAPAAPAALAAPPPAATLQQHASPRPAAHHPATAHSPVQQQPPRPGRVNSHLARTGPGGATGSGSGSGLLSRLGSGLYQIYRPASMRWSSAVDLVGDRISTAAAAVAAAAAGRREAEWEDVRRASGEFSALLLFAVRQLACVAQVVLDAAQIAAVLLSQDLVFRLPDWAAVAFSALVITQASSWQWVPFDCLLPGWSNTSGAAFQVILVLLLPIAYCCLLLPLLVAVADTARHYIQRPRATRSGALGSFVEHCSSAHSVIKMTGRLQSVPPGWSSASSDASCDASWTSSQPQLQTIPSDASMQQQPQPQLVGLLPLPPPPQQQQQQQQQQLRLQPEPPGAAKALQQGMDAAPSNARDTSAKTISPFAAAATKPAYSASSDRPDAPSLGPDPHTDTASMTDDMAGGWMPAAQLQQQSHHAVFHLGRLPAMRSRAVLVGALAVASMSYCYGLFTSTLLGALSCMQLAPLPSVPGEVRLQATYWVPDLQLQCWTGPHIGVAVVAIVIGVPLLLCYWLLLLVLAWPTHVPARPAAAAPPAAPGGLACLSWMPRVPRLVQQLLHALLLPPVRFCQRFTLQAGISGFNCAGLNVWNWEWCWWWLLGRELAKFAVFFVAAVTSMRAPHLQALVVLMLVVAAGGVSWQAQVGGSTTMNRLLFLANLLLQLLALTLLVTVIADVNMTSYAAALVAVIGVAALYLAGMLAGLALRCMSAGKQISRFLQDLAAVGYA